MHFREWSRGNADYGRKLVQSGLSGAHDAQDEFLHGEPLTPFLNESMRNAWKPAAIGVCLGVLGSYPGNRSRTTGRMLTCGLLGGLLGLVTGVAWQSRRLTGSLAHGAWRSISRVRDEHWFEKHPIDYA